MKQKLNMKNIFHSLILGHALFLCCFAGSQKAQAMDIDNIFQNDYLEIEDILLPYTLKKDVAKIAKEKTNISDQELKRLLNDPDKKVDQAFKVPPYFKDSVLFWFKIYVQVSSDQVLIHDKNHLGLVYDFIDFADLANLPFNRYIRANLKSRLINDKVNNLKETLLSLDDSRTWKTPQAKTIFKKLRDANMSVPRNKQKAKAFFADLASNLRTQTGLRDHVFKGIVNSRPFLPFLNQYLETFELPKELLSIAFVESSFNIMARSRVGASGVWQFMPSIANDILPMDKQTDGRDSVIIASLGAFHLLKQNYKLLSRWDLSVTAYNSGTKHLLKAQKEMNATAPMALEDILQHYEHPHIGFASVNFYSEFLAMTYARAYQDLLYPMDEVKEDASADQDELRPDRLHVYLSKCGLIPSRLFDVKTNAAPMIRIINNHLHYPEKMYGRGTIIISDSKLDENRYYQLRPEDTRTFFPKNWKKHLGNQSCSM